MVDPALLNRLAREKLLAQAEALRGEAGAWIEVSAHLHYADLAAYGHVADIERDPTDEEREKLNRLQAEQNAVQAQLDEMEAEDESFDAVEQRLQQLSTEEDELREGFFGPDPEQNAVGGTLLSIDREGDLKIHRGLLKPEDAARFAGVSMKRVKAAADRPQRTHTAAMALRLSAHRTLALQATVATNTKVAMAALAQHLILNTFFHSADLSVRIEVGDTRVETHADDLVGSKAYAALAARHTELQAKLPEDDDKLLPWLLAQSDDVVAELMAFCVSKTLDAIQSHEGPYRASALAQAANLDMSEWWAPTAAGYLGKLKRDAIMEIVKTVVSPEQAARLEKLKKAEMASAAERCLEGKHWVPECFKGNQAA